MLAAAQVELLNPGFEEPGIGKLPKAWSVPEAGALYSIERVEVGCMTGPGCVQFTPGPQSFAKPGILEQTFRAPMLRDLAMNWVVAVKLEKGARAALHVVVKDVEGREMQLGISPLAAQPPVGEWGILPVSSMIPVGAMSISVQIHVWNGKALVDSFSVLSGQVSSWKSGEAPSPLSRTALNNLMAFAKLFGVVRHFHPSDEASEADWAAIALDGVRRLDYATQPESLARRFNEVFAGVAPTVKAYVGEAPPVPAELQPEGKKEVTRWVHKGFGQPGPTVYKSNRENKAAASWRAEDLYTLDLPRGLKARVPLAVFRDENGTLPRPAVAGPKVAAVAMESYTGDDRATRLATVIIAWNIFRHFYPYADVAKVDWDDLLAKTMQQAGEDRDADQFAFTLRGMVAQLHDGHGSVMHTPRRQRGRLPLGAQWIEGALLVVGASTGIDAKAGDEIVSIDGVPALNLLLDAEKMISGATPQWKRRMAAQTVLVGNVGERVVVELNRRGREKNVMLDLNYGQGGGAVYPDDPRPTEKVTELEPGIWYADLTRMVDADWASALPQLEKARGIVFDLRGYPRLGPNWLRHLSKTPIDSAQWHVPRVTMPGQMEFERAPGWNLQPATPYLEAKRVVLTHGGAISYAESTMGIIEHYKLCEIVGETTAGTNGNINPFVLPGGYRISWTGMKVLKHDGSRHHGVGIAPTVPVSRTRAGVMEGKDEELARGLALVR